MYSIQNYEEKYCFNNLITQDDCFTDMLIFKTKLCFVLATQQGKLSVLKLDNSASLLHEFNKANKSITKLSRHPVSKNYVLVACLDGTIRSYCIERFC